MRIYPVMDLRGGVVVHARGGERERYAPISSRIALSPEPLVVARAFRDRLDLDRVYVADLDAIGGAEPARAVLRALVREGFQLLVDAGARSAAAAAELLDLGAAEVVAALETVPDPGVLAAMVRRVGAGRLVFSLDLKGGIHLGDRAGWGFGSPEDVARAAHTAGARRLLVLDLARVGSAAGPAHLDLLRLLARELAEVELLAGGGIRSVADLALLAGAGAAAALVGTALHDGVLGRPELDAARSLYLRGADF